MLLSVVPGVDVAGIVALTLSFFRFYSFLPLPHELGSADFGGTVLSPDEVAVSMVTTVCSVVADVVAMESVIYKTKPTACNPEAPESAIENTHNPRAHETPTGNTHNTCN